MSSTGIAQLKASLSRYLLQVKRGDEIIVTEHGEPIAKLIPYRASGKHAAAREALARLGIVELGTGRVDAALLQPAKIRDPKHRMRSALHEDREETV